MTVVVTSLSSRLDNVILHKSSFQWEQLTQLRVCGETAVSGGNGKRFINNTCSVGAPYEKLNYCAIRHQSDKRLRSRLLNQETVNATQFAWR